MSPGLKYNVYLRGDGGKNQGWGHINRLISLAFILKDHFSLECISSKEGADLFRNVIGEFAQIREVSTDSLGKFHQEWPEKPETGILIIDGYHFDAAYRASAKKTGLKVVLIDDFATGPFNHEDVIINHAPDSCRFYDTDRAPRICCGIEYALLRPEFYEQHVNERRIPNQILLSMGGADPNGVTYQILSTAAPLFPDFHWIVVCTNSFGSDLLEKLEALKNGTKNISIRMQLDAAAMHNLMLESGKAVLSSSTVLIEAWASGLYPAAICYTENQRMIYDGATHTGIAFPLQADKLGYNLDQYLNTATVSKMRGLDWNPPQRVLKVMQELIAS